jgi:hypothetical protein
MKLNLNNKLLILLSLFVISCGTRNVHKTETKTEEQTTIVDTSKTVTKSETQNKVVDTSVIDNLEIVSKDTTKPLVIDGHKYFNAIIKHSKEKKHITTTQENKSVTEDKKGVTTVRKSRTVEMVKDTHRESFNWWWLFFIIPIIIILLIIRYRKQIIEDLPI